MLIAFIVYGICIEVFDMRVSNYNCVLMIHIATATFYIMLHNDFRGLKFNKKKFKFNNAKSWDLSTFILNFLHFFSKIIRSKNHFNATVHRTVITEI